MKISLKYATLEDMDEADEFCVGKGYDGAADKLTRQELDDLHAEWKSTLAWLLSGCRFNRLQNPLT